MPAFAPNWTGRLKISYFGAGAVHSTTWRYPGPASGSGVTDLITTITNYLTALEPLLWDDYQVNAVTVADIDSSVFLPIPNPFGDIVGESTTTTLTPEDKAYTVGFVGRSTGGHPWHILQFGLAVSGVQAGNQKNFRLLNGESPEVDNAIAALEAGAGTVLANDANSVAFYQYANIKTHDRWVKKVRRGA